MEQDRDVLISRVLAGESTSDEEIRLIEWLNEDKRNLEHLAGSEKTWIAIDIILNRDKYNHEKAFSQFRSKIKNSLKVRRQKGLFSLSEIAKKSLQWAAIALILVGSGGTISYFAFIHPYDSSPSIIEVIVPPGSRNNIILADGTSVWLNADSKLSYSNDFGINDRTVTLQGEGYFSVASDNKNPFRVITSQLEIKALGTSFNVKCYPEENIIQTTLVSGSIQVTRRLYKQPEKGLIMDSNQQLTYYLDSSKLLLDSKTDDRSADEYPLQTEKEAVTDQPRILLSREIDPEIFTSWKDNRLIFDNEPFESIAVKLERRFGANIIIKEEEIKDKKFKGRFDEITLEQALNALKFASPFEYYIQQDTIYITSQ